MAVKIYEPKISVILRKNIGRATVSGNIAASRRFQGAAREIDLTPYLGKNSAVIVGRSTRQMPGWFSITVADKMVPAQLESLYGLIEPMDVVEIRMAHDTSQYAGSLPQNMPIRMWGIVSDVGRREIFQSGKPRRAVVITGQDYSKMLLINRIVYLPNMVTGQKLLSYFKLFVNYGLGANPDQDASAFVSDVVTNVVNHFIADMRTAAEANGVAGGVSPLLDLNVDTLVKGGIVSPFGTNQWPGGTIRDLLTYYGDVGPWNEMFIEDREDGPYLVYRPNPFKDPSGNFIQDPYKSDSTSAPKSVTVYDDDLSALETNRSDSAVFNYFWADNPSYQLVEAPILQAQIANSADNDLFYLTDYPNSSPYLYGLRDLQVQSQQGPRFDGQEQSAYAKKRGEAVAFIQNKIDILKQSNRDNVVFESGTMRLRGNEQITPGTFVKLVRGVDRSAATSGSGFVAEYYAHTVTDQYLPFRSYTTTVQFDRGTGFIKRAQRDNRIESPYLTEMRAGGAYA